MNPKEEQAGQAVELTVDTATFHQQFRKFAKDATVRALRTMAQTAAAFLSAKALIGDVDWKTLLSATLMSGIYSILTSVYTGLPETEAAKQTALLEGGGSNAD